jgi:hypothetical protein
VRGGARPDLLFLVATPYVPRKDSSIGISRPVSVSMTETPEEPRESPPAQSFRTSSQALEARNNTSTGSILHSALLSVSSNPLTLTRLDAVSVARLILTCNVFNGEHPVMFMLVLFVSH